MICARLNLYGLPDVGAATPLGNELAEIEANLLAGRSGVSLVTRFNTDDYPSRIAAQLAEPLVPSRGDAIRFAARQPLDQLAYFCIEAALRDASLWEQYREQRVGLVLGIGAEWMLHWEADSLKGGMRLYKPEQDHDSTIVRVHKELGLSGPALAISAACASGNHALEIGRLWLRQGLVDVCIAGACDLAVTPIGLATFGNLRAYQAQRRSRSGVTPI